MIVVDTFDVTSLLQVKKKILMLALRKKCPYSELFWSVFSRNRTEYGPE